MALTLKGELDMMTRPEPDGSSRGGPVVWQDGVEVRGGWRCESSEVKV